VLFVGELPMSESYLKLCRHGVTGYTSAVLTFVGDRFLSCLVNMNFACERDFDVQRSVDVQGDLDDVQGFYYQQFVQTLPLHIKSLQADTPVEYGDVEFPRTAHRYSADNSRGASNNIA
jgi:hypothetical protein